MTDTANTKHKGSPTAATTDAVSTSEAVSTTDAAPRYPSNGLAVERVYTTPGKHPYDEVQWERRDARITNYRDGTVAFEQLAVEVPVRRVTKAPVNFYRPESYRAEESIGFMMKRILASISQTMEARLCEPGGPTYPQWIPLHKLHMGQATTVAEGPQHPV